jgi:glyoxylase-like metal-dependent hydrolase (beta-lactamase superfamily II)
MRLRARVAKHIGSRCASLSKLVALLADTLVYCSHEYRPANIRCALTADPKDATLLARSLKAFSILP